MTIGRRSLIALTTSAAGFAMLGVARAADPLKVAIVMPGNITDKSWSQSGCEGIMQAKEKLGIEVAYSMSACPQDILPINKGKTVEAHYQILS